MKHLPVALIGLLAILGACGGIEDDGDRSASASAPATAPEAFFAVENADALAHAALPTVEELVGNGWELTSSDAVEEAEEDGGDLDFENALIEEEECAGLSALSEMGGVFGEDTEDGPPAGQAQVEFENPLHGPDIPSSIEVEIEIEDTVAEVQSGWGIAKQLMEGDDFERCMLAIIHRSVAADAEGMEFEITSRTSSAAPPKNGVAIAFDMTVGVADIEIPMAIEIYMWPYANAATTITVLGSPESFDAISVSSTLALVERKLADAAAA